MICDLGKNDFYRTSRIKLFFSTPLLAGVAVPCCVFWIQFGHAAACGALLEGVFAANVHDHLNVLGFVDVELLTHGPKELVFAGRDDAVLEHHFNHVPIVLNR